MDHDALDHDAVFGHAAELHNLGDMSVSILETTFVLIETLWSGLKFRFLNKFNFLHELVSLDVLVSLDILGIGIVIVIIVVAPVVVLLAFVMGAEVREPHVERMVVPLMRRHGHLRPGSCLRSDDVRAAQSEPV